ncbi:ankyrin repeat-containing domain protein [Pestalotiopsis sp. NC0098]|nr:ankyrin repeat-containing domain protein [Pestalotiopsis sp. NC0098]
MAPTLSADEIDDLIYLARAGEDAELTQLLKELAEREKVTVAEVLEAARDEGKATCLHMAAANGHSKTVTHILTHLPTSSLPSPGPSSTSPSSGSIAPPEAYINVANEYGNTALHWACLGGHLDTIKLLLSRGANPTVANAKDQIPLDCAAFNNHMHVVEHFLSQSRQKEEQNAKEGGLEGAVGGVEVDVEEEVEEENVGESSKA